MSYFPERPDQNLHAFAFSHLSAERSRMPQKPLVIWMTGISASGKSTIADALDMALQARGRLTCIIDGDSVRSGLCRDLSQAYDNGELDLVLLKQRRNSREGVACWPERLQWIDSARTPAFELDPIPLVTFPPRGLYREDMINAIEGMGRRWRISFTSSSLSGIQAAVADGMGISLLPPRAATGEHRVLGAGQGLPEVDSYEIVIVHRPTADVMVKALAEVMAQLLAGGGI